MEQNDHFNVFFEENNTQTLLQQEKELPLPQSLPYLKRGDSNKYIQQFFAKQEMPKDQQPVKNVIEKVKSSSVEEDEEFSFSERDKFSPSSFHNFQKHLTVALKHSIQIKIAQGESQDFKLAADCLWKYFKGSSINTKKVLHYLLGQQNQHKITDSVLKHFGLYKIYDQYGQKTMRQARAFLSNETLRQMRQGKINQYIESKKLKDKNRFQKYLQIFMQQLEAGFLKKRLSKEKALELQNCS